VPAALGVAVERGVEKEFPKTTASGSSWRRSNHGFGARLWDGRPLHGAPLFSPAKSEMPRVKPAPSDLLVRMPER
jgi:hypothetical protein